MPLPGKLCIGILEEDNPLKSYFRFKPLLVESEGVYAPFEEADAYPEDGCIRIVPDKNESSHFKARMRRMGLFAVVDLRDHPNENDKIRVNKNYHGDETERNASIIYSDVVREPAADMIFSLLKRSPEDAENSVLEERPATARALLCPDDVPLGESWVCESDEEQPDCMRLHSDGKTVDVSSLQVFCLKGFGERMLSFAIAQPSTLENVIEPPAPKPARPATPEVHKEPAQPAAPAAPAEEPAPAAEAAPEKPWGAAEPASSVQVIKATMPPLKQSLAAQSGLNPRRGRSLQEIIDEKWRHSRIDQLGHPVPAMASGQPLMSPLEKAVEAIEAVWQNDAQRAELLSALNKMDGMEAALADSRASAQESAINRRLNELEAQRLEILGDLDTLKRRKADLREELKQEIRRDEAAAFAEAVQKTKQAQEECARHEAAASQAKAAAQSAQDALNALADGRYEERLREFAVNSHAIELLRRLDAKEKPVEEPKGVSADAAELIRRVAECFADAGCSISRVEVVNLLILAAQSPVLLVSGPSGCGKTTVVRLLARALGVEAPRYAEYSVADEPKNLPSADKLPCMALLDDANTAAETKALPALVSAAEQGKLTACIALQDEGANVPAPLLGRAFMLRLTEAGVNTPWQPAPRGVAKTYEPVSIDVLRSTFGPRTVTLPQTLLKRMEQLRTDLNRLGVRLSRRTLNAMWNYCSAAVSMLSLEPTAVLDLALSQRAVPAILASAPLSALVELPRVLGDLPRCKRLISEALPIQM